MEQGVKMTFKWDRPNEGRLHKGNPFGAFGTSITDQISRTTDQIAGQGARLGDDLGQLGDATMGALGDPAPWLAYMLDPTGITSGFLGVEAAKENYDLLNEAEQLEARAQAEAAMASEEEARLLQEQEDAQREQERLTAERQKAADEQARERSTRLGKGRRGLLYQGNEQGVGSNTLGGYKCYIQKSILK